MVWNVMIMILTNHSDQQGVISLPSDLGWMYAPNTVAGIGINCWPLIPALIELCDAPLMLVFQFNALNSVQSLAGQSNK